jgi:hypothetical protein
VRHNAILNDERVVALLVEQPCHWLPLVKRAVSVASTRQDHDRTARLVRVQQIDIEPGAKSVLNLWPRGGSRPKPEA